MRTSQPSRRLLRVALPLLAGAAMLGVAACGGSGTDVEGTCIAVVNVNGVFMTPSGASIPPDSVSDAYVSITRNTGCLDQGEPSSPLLHAESNFLAVGVSLHRVLGFEPDERLAVQRPTGEWDVLVPWDLP